MNRDDEIRMRALRAAKAVTLGAMFTGAVACTEEPGTSNNRQWQTGNNENDMAGPTDMSITPDQDPPPPPVDMTPDVVVEPDQDPPPPPDMEVKPDLDPPPPDMVEDPCDDETADGVCPDTCAPKDDVDCCNDRTDDLRECTFDAALGCECVEKPQCLPQPDNQCPSTCDEKTDADCCAASAQTGFTCTFDPSGACDCEPDRGICDNGASDNSCPGNCTEMDDADCCVKSAPEGRECRWGGFGGFPFPGCGCRDIPKCETTRDSLCPDYCTALTDADCCAAMATQPGEACVLGANGCECVMQVACDMTQQDSLCPQGCNSFNDADCCAADGFCNYDMASQQCFCAVPGPFVPPTMRRRNARRRRDR